MSKLPKYTLTYSVKKENWKLENDKTNKIIKTFETKEEATKRDVLKKAIGGIGSVKIQKMDGKFEEERTYPKSFDPISSKG